MIQLELKPPAKRPLRVLALGAHSDDIEIGCGGSLLKLTAEHRGTEFYWVVFSAGTVRDTEAYKSANLFLKTARRRTVVVKDFRNSFFPYVATEIKEYFEELKRGFAPDVIFTHCRNDLHQDHRLLCELTWNTFRDHFILEYEIPKYDGDLGAPNAFVQLDPAICRRKVNYILSAFKSQRSKKWFTEDTFRGLMRIRGVESNAPGKYAEAFYCRKLALS